MLVEDDNNLREIYEARLLAEGYEIVSARDGEEALAMAVKELPDLIISDVMMPKISGFDMLDILRGTPETRNTKVIMMTALSQAEDKARAEALGADRYLVKSQVTLEDVAKATRDVLEGTSPPAEPVVTADPVASADDNTAPAATMPSAPPATPTTAVATSSTAPTTDDENQVMEQKIQDFVNTTPSLQAEVVTAPAPEQVSSAPIVQDPANTALLPIAPIETSSTTSSPKTGGERVVQPPADSTTGPDIHALLAAEEKKEAAALDPVNTVITPTTTPTSPPADNPVLATPPADDDPNNIAL